MGAHKDRLKADLAGALRAKDEAAKSNIRMPLAAITNAEVAGDSAKQLTDDEELAVLTKEHRQRKDSAQTYAEAGRDDLATKEAAEAEFIATYLPTPLTEEELKAIVAEEVAAFDAPSMKQMGQIVKAVNARVAGRAEGKTVATLVRAALV